MFVHNPTTIGQLVEIIDSGTEDCLKTCKFIFDTNDCYLMIAKNFDCGTNSI